MDFVIEMKDLIEKIFQNFEENISVKVVNLF